MKTTRTLFVKMTAILLGVSFAAHAYAGTAREELVHAYTLLKHADHDYDGHRLKAMAAIESAGKDLGLKLESDSPEKERQFKSDKKVAEARKLLREARKKLEERDRKLVAERVDLAVKELNAALKIK